MAPPLPDNLMSGQKRPAWMTDALFGVAAEAGAFL
jgi:hypothetical protein